MIGTIRRECVDHVVALGEQHLRQVLKSYAKYYNTARTHRSLNKDAPVTRPVQQIGRIVSHAMVGPPAAKAIRDGGGKYIVRGGETAAFYGEPPKPRIAIMAFESMEQAKAAFNSSAYKEATKAGDKYAKFRVYAVEGLLQ
jgi:uncharacterized protein (DUF1330 family)